MKRKFFSSLVAVLLPAWVYALGLGNLELNSGLNQPFDARIELLYATAEELQTLTIGLADSAAFQRAGIDRPFILSNLRFTVDSSGEGAAYILISSRKPVREPFLNFLLEANWSKGRLYREYTVLLDPPLYDPNARRIRTADTIEVDTDSEGDADFVDDGSVEGYDDEAISAPDDPSSVMQIAGDYGPTTADDTLWSVAAQMRPDSSVSIQQMMLALLRANPEAFLDNNINGLKRGEILRMPTADELYRYGQSEALAETRLQNDLWEEARGFIAATTTERAESGGIRDSYSVMDDNVMDDSVGDNAIAETDGSAELRLVVASDGSAASGQFDGNRAGSDENLALVNEQLEALSQENAELRERMVEADTIINDLERLISLKDDELAAMQQQLSEAVPTEELEPLADFEAEDAEAVTEEPADVQADDDEAAADEQAGAVDEEPPFAVEETVPVVEELREEEAPEQEAAAVVEDAEEPPVGMLDQAMGFVTDNMPMIAAVLGGLLLVIGLVVFLIKRKRNAESKVVVPVVGATEFSDFNNPADEAWSADGEADEVEAEATDATAQQAEPESEDDPLTEVNVFLAYEQFDQAEEFVRDAITRQPENVEFHAKLLEVFYAAGNKKAYEEEARALNQLVGGKGPHWGTALVMWTEMSPNRALFAEPLAGEDDEVTATGGGIVDLTTNEGGAAAAADDAGLDFDLDMGGAEQPPAAAASDDKDDILDLTAAAGSTASAGNEPEDDILDLTASMGGTEAEAQDEDVLDLSADVGLDAGSGEAPADSGADENMLDITGGGAAADEGMLDITSSGAAEDSLLEVPGEAAQEDNTLDFDIGDIGGTGDAATSEGLEIGGGDADNVIEFDAALGGETESSAADDGGLEVDLSVGGEADLDIGIDAPESEGDEIGLDVGASDDNDDGAFALDIDMDDAGAELDLSVGADAGTMDDDLSIDLDADSEEEAAHALEIGAEDGSLPEIDLDLGDAAADDEPAIVLDVDDDDDDMRTVFIPRSSDANEQSADDEMATKLDLAKAYVELGDKDSAKSILDEVIADGNDEQKQQAQDLLSQA